jgi:hypothetical protein
MYRDRDYHSIQRASKRMNRNSKRTVDYDSDYEYPDSSDENGKEHKAYMHEGMGGMSASPLKGNLMPKTNTKAAHLVGGTITPNNTQYHYPNYSGQVHEQTYPSEHDYQQRQIEVKRSRLPAHAVTVLKDWFYKHSHSPYPTEEEKERFTKELSLTILQVNNWFTNARRRLLPDKV